VRKVWSVRYWDYNIPYSNFVEWVSHWYEYYSRTSQSCWYHHMWNFDLVRKPRLSRNLDFWVHNNDVSLWHGERFRCTNDAGMYHHMRKAWSVRLLKIYIRVISLAVFEEWWFRRMKKALIIITKLWKAWSGGITEINTFCILNEGFRYAKGADAYHIMVTTDTVYIKSTCNHRWRLVWWDLSHVSGRRWRTRVICVVIWSFGFLFITWVSLLSQDRRIQEVRGERNVV
jgi:hypothetical protein